MNINRFDWIATGQVNNIQLLGEAQEITVVTVITGTPSVIQIRRVWRASDRSKTDLIRPKLNRVVRISGMQFETVARCFQTLLDHASVNQDHIIGFAWRRTRVQK